MVLSMAADMCVHIFTDVMFAVYEVAFLLKNGIACHVCSKEIFLFLFFYNVGHNLYMFPFLTRPVPETFILIWSWWSLVLAINLKVYLSGFNYLCVYSHVYVNLIAELTLQNI